MPEPAGGGRIRVVASDNEGLGLFGESRPAQLRRLILPAGHAEERREHGGGRGGAVFKVGGGQVEERQVGQPGVGFTRQGCGAEVVSHSSPPRLVGWLT